MRTLLVLLLSVSFLLANDSPYIKKAEQLLKEHQFTQIEKLLKDHQDDPDALYYLSVVKLLRGKIDAALELAEKGLKKAKDKDRFYEWMGDIYSVKAQNSNMFSAMMTVSKIKKYWQKAIEFNPRNMSAREKLFMFYLMAPGIAGGDEQKAEALIEEVKAEDPLRALLMQARFYRKKKEFDRAERFFLQAFKMAPDSLPVLQEVASYYMEQKQFARARNYLQKIVRVKPDSFVGYDLFGDFYKQQGKADSALMQYDLALKKDPYQYRTEFKKVKLLAKMGRKDEARKLANKILHSEVFFTMKKRVKAFLDEL